MQELLLESYPFTLYVMCGKTVKVFLNFNESTYNGGVRIKSDKTHSREMVSILQETKIDQFQKTCSAL